MFTDLECGCLALQSSDRSSPNKLSPKIKDVRTQGPDLLFLVFAGSDHGSSWGFLMLTTGRWGLYQPNAGRHLLDE